VEESIADAPSYPKSLYLIQPLFAAHELNPVASSAQASVPVPDGLNLDEWFSLPPPEPAIQPEEPGPTEKKLKKKKGKEKDDSDGRRTSKKRKGKETELISNGDVLTPMYDESELPEDEEVRARVRGTVYSYPKQLDLTFLQRKAERLAQLKDDPYYILDEKPKDKHDVDSIPVVRLDDLPSLSTRRLSEIGARSFFLLSSAGATDEGLVSLRMPSHSPGSQSFTVDRDGEMPTNARAISTPPQKTATPAPQPGSSHSALSSFQQYDVPDSDLRASTPEAIKVVRSKKSGKKKKSKP
jgi:AP-3 complex subunit delta